MSEPEFHYRDDDCTCNDPDCSDCALACTWCGGDRIGGGCDNALECCGVDFCHACDGTGSRTNQRIF